MGIARAVVFLAVLTPCVEFLTGSTSAIAVLTNPTSAVVFVLLTLPGYIFPVLLIREALVVWGKGLPSLLALGIGYGAFNEGLLAKTYFSVNPLSPPLGVPPGVGEWIGVNWPWVTGITLFHMIVSMAVPVVLSFLLFPETRTARFLTDRQVRAMITLLTVEVLALLAIQSTFSLTFRGLLPLMFLPASILFLGYYFGRRLAVPDLAGRLTGRLSQPRWLALTSFVFFLITFLPILRFFPIAFVPDVLLSNALSGLSFAQGILITLYPLALAILAIRFFTRHPVTDRQLVAITAGVMFLPLVTAISIHDLPQGDWAAAVLYIAALVAAWRRSGRSEHVWTSLGPPVLAPPPATIT